MVDRRSPIVRAAAFLLATSLLAGCNKIDAWRLARLRERKSLLTDKIEENIAENLYRCMINPEVGDCGPCILNPEVGDCGPDYKAIVGWKAELDIVEREIRQILDEE